MKLLPTLFVATLLGCSSQSPPLAVPKAPTEDRPEPDPNLEIVLDTAEEYVSQIVDAMDAACGTLHPEAAEACRHAVVVKWLPRMRAIVELRKKNGLVKRPEAVPAGPYADRRP